MKSFIRQLVSLFNKAEKRQAAWLFVLMLFASASETVGVASIMPFIAVLAKPEVLVEIKALKQAYEWSGVTDRNEFLFLLGGAVFFILVSANILGAYTQAAVTAFGNNKAFSLTRRLLIYYLEKPYSYHLNRNSAEIKKNITGEISIVVKAILIPFMQALARMLKCLFIVGLLVFVDPKLTLTTLGVLSAAYGLVYFFVHGRLAKLGKDRSDAARQQSKIVTETFAAIKEIKLYGRENIYLEYFIEPAYRTSKYNTINENIAILPRYLFETLMFAGILSIVMYLISTHGGLNEALPVIALFALAGQRILPALQQVFASAAKIRFSLAALETISREMQGQAESYANIELTENDGARLPFRQKLELRDVSYSYPQSTRPVVNKLNLVIEPNTTVGFVGGTGAGKTTMIDIILGLLPIEGEVLVDGKVLNDDNRRQWQNNIGYVSQHIVLFDDSVAANIACGMPEAEVDMAAVEKAGKMACLDEYVMKELSNGYRSHIGENGKRLSGGQRQRVGIARALYADPDLLVFDEATSALDNITERAVIEQIHTLSRKKTILMVAHRLTTVMACDVIHMMENGRIIGSGPYEELLKTCPEFRKLAGILAQDAA